MIQAFESLSLQALKVGDTFGLPNGKSLNIDESMVHQDRCMLTFTGNPFPIDVQRIDGIWKVNPESFITVRKKAMELQNANRN